MDHEEHFCRLVSEYALLENEQFEEPLRFLLESRRPFLLRSFVSILEKSGIKEESMVKELSTEWFYVMLEGDFTPAVIYEHLLSILN